MSASRAAISACPVPRCSACSTKFTPVPATASRTRSASCPTITKISFAGTTFCAAAITCARIGLPPTSCRTLGCFDLSRVPFPAAMIAMATRGRGGFDAEAFDLVFVAVCGAFAMLSQYTAPESTPYRLPVRSLRHQRHQVVRDAIGRVPRHLALIEIISQDRTHAEGLDCFQVHDNL